MRFNSSLYLKWIDAKNDSLKGASFNVVNLCTLAAKNKSGKITGITVFEPKDLTDSFFSRLAVRKSRPEFMNSDFVLYLPQFLKQRVESLLKSNSGLSIEVHLTPFLNLKQNGDGFFVRKTLRVVSVDDSQIMLKFLKRAMSELSFIEVVAQVSDSREAVATVEKMKPDLVTLDIQMPHKTGVEVLKELLSKDHYPVLMISSLNFEEGSLVFEALNSGAFDFIQKPKLEDMQIFKEELSEKFLLAVDGKAQTTANQKLQANRKKVTQGDIQYPDNLIWCIGASTGGTQALTRVFTTMPAQIPPTLIVQHIPPVFSRAFADSLNNLCPFKVKEAEHGEPILPSHVYIAPGGIQMGVERIHGKMCISLKDAPLVNRFKPSVDYMFLEVSKIKGIQVVAGVMTGMGRDGAAGLLELKKNGARTFVQDEESCTVYGMPRAAFELGATDQLVPLDSIAQKLLEQSLPLKKVG
jgi:two-component system, chemotaxis family, protein-glutamate methylesterase/glutaminase